jgi:hypothetical protein
MPLDFLKGLTLVEKESEFVRGERLECEKVAKAWRHIVTRRMSENALFSHERAGLRTGPGADGLGGNLEAKS